MTPQTFYNTLITLHYNNSSMTTTPLILQYETSKRKKIDLTPLHVMRVPNSPDFAGTHLYTWVE